MGSNGEGGGWAAGKGRGGVGGGRWELESGAMETFNGDFQWRPLMETLSRGEGTRNKKERIN